MSFFECVCVWSSNRHCWPFRTLTNPEMEKQQKCTRYQPIAKSFTEMFLQNSVHRFLSWMLNILVNTHSKVVFFMQLFELLIENNLTFLPSGFILFKTNGVPIFLAPVYATVTQLRKVYLQEAVDHLCSFHLS